MTEIERNEEPARVDGPCEQLKAVQGARIAYPWWLIVFIALMAMGVPMCKSDSPEVTRQKAERLEKAKASWDKLVTFPERTLIRFDSSPYMFRVEQTGHEEVRIRGPRDNTSGITLVWGATYGTRVLDGYWIPGTPQFAKGATLWATQP